jgi:hypothetical protein
MFTHICGYWDMGLFENDSKAKPVEPANVIARFGTAIRNTWGIPTDYTLSTGERVFNWLPPKDGYNSATFGGYNPPHTQKGTMSSPQGRETMFLQSLMDIFPDVAKEANLIAWINSPQSTQIDDNGILKTTGFEASTAETNHMETVLARIGDTSFKTPNGFSAADHDRNRITRVLKDAIVSEERSVGVRFEIESIKDRMQEIINSKFDFIMAKLNDSFGNTEMNEFEFRINEIDNTLNGEGSPIIGKSPDSMEEKLKIINDLPKFSSHYKEAKDCFDNINICIKNLRSLGGDISEEEESHFNELQARVKVHFDTQNGRLKHYSEIVTNAKEAAK